jgi:2-keto-4-pentenoate hydratase
MVTNLLDIAAPSSAQTLIQEAARLLLEARSMGQPLAQLPAHCRPTTVEEAYAIQDLILQELGPIGGWKVGAKNAEAEPICAPLPRDGITAGAAALETRCFRMRGVEVEVGMILKHDLPPRLEAYTLDEVIQAIGHVCVAVEIVESRFQDNEKIDRPSTLADLASHGVAIYAPLGVGVEPMARWLNPHARLALDSGTVLASTSQNPAGDIRRLLVWLANHASRRRLGLLKGQIIITGSCLPMLRAQAIDGIHAELDGIGRLEVRFVEHLPA